MRKITIELLIKYRCLWRVVQSNIMFWIEAIKVFQFKNKDENEVTKRGIL